MSLDDGSDSSELSGITDGGESEVEEQVVGQIPKPAGEAGRPGRGGYNLEKVLGWHADELKQLKVWPPQSHQMSC